MNSSPTLADYAIELTNANFNLRVVENALSLPRYATNNEGVSVSILEAAELHGARLTLLIFFEPGASYNLGQHHGGEELLVLHGLLQSNYGDCPPGTYSRNPTHKAHQPSTTEGCVVFAKLGEFAPEDHEQRLTDTNDTDNWLPGPADGIDVLPLHMHDTRSVLMLRWNEDATFKPHLDPQGEEIFVVHGELSDQHGNYPAGTWIRNPIPAWQPWSGRQGTLIYYKNGHFPSEHG